MINDPELKAMSDVYDALRGLDADTQSRVTDWVLGKLKSDSSAGTKRGPKPGRRRGRPAKAKAAGAKRGPKPGKKRGRPAGAVKKAGKRGRPAGSGKKRGRGRPSKAETAAA